MKSLEIVKYPDARLRIATTDVLSITTELRTFIDDLVNTMYVHEGLGIAANQVGRSEKIFIIDGRLNGEDNPIIFINPQIIETSNIFSKSNEGCLSFPGIFVDIERPNWVKIKALDIDLKSFELEGTGLLARALLHEFDHLSGKLMIDMVSSLKKDIINKKIKKQK